METVVRAAKRADLSTLVAALLRLNQHGTTVDARYRLAEGAEARLAEHLSLRWFDRFHPFPPCLVAEQQGQLVGLVSGEVVVNSGILEEAPTARIDNLWVSPEARRKGLGKRLVETYTERCRLGGFGRMVVSTLYEDAQARAFWEAIGFSSLRVTLLRGPA